MLTRPTGMDAIALLEERGGSVRERVVFVEG